MTQYHDRRYESNRSSETLIEHFRDILSETSVNTISSRLSGKNFHVTQSLHF